MKNGFKETEIGDIPVDWEVVRLEEVAKNYDKQRIPLSKNQRQTMSGSYPYCGANGIIDFINDISLMESLSCYLKMEDTGVHLRTRLTL